MSNVNSQETCRRCGRLLEPSTFNVHHQTKHELEWLLENRKQIADEQTIGEVLERLISLEVTKRRTIEERKASRSKQQRNKS